MDGCEESAGRVGEIPIADDALRQATIILVNPDARRGIGATDAQRFHWLFPRVVRRLSAKSAAEQLMIS
jgi:hypothetical protein